MTFDARVEHPSGSVGIYSGDVYQSGYVTTRGGSPEFYWHFDGETLVPKVGLIGARLCKEDGSVVSPILDPKQALPGHRIEVLYRDGETWHHAGVILEVLPTLQFDILDDGE